MSKKCVKCGQPLPDNASFCPHCTAVQTEKQEVKAPKRWKKAALSSSFGDCGSCRGSFFPASPSEVL